MTTGTLTLSDFLFARIAEDEAEMPYLFSEGEWFGVNGVAVDLRTRVLAECEAKRRIVEMAEAMPACTTHDEARDPACDECRACDIVSGYDQTILELVALPYADHPDYREEWRP